jgi:long-subunit fatty acid transport protein
MTELRGTRWAVRGTGRPGIGAVAAAGCVMLGLLLSGAGAAGAADTPVELQETNLFGMGARALGMGKAYTAVAEDVSAVVYNPAGLAQIRRIEFSTGLAYNDLTSTVTHFARRSQDLTSTRLDHVALAYPIPTYRGSAVLSFSFNRMADLDVNYFKEGFAIPVTVQTPGLYELESYDREGAVNQWSVAGAMDLSPNLSVGVSVSYLSGKSTEDLALANYLATQSGNEVSLSLGDPSNPDDRLFRQDTHRESSLDGYTGSLGILGYLDNGVRIGAAVDLPRKLKYDVTETYRLEDWQKIDNSRGSYRDDITLPVTLKGGVSWGTHGLLLSGGVRWTDYSQINFEGKILAPPVVENGITLQREAAYRSVVAVNAGAEYQFPTVPLRVRAGFFTEPIPYKLIAADTDFQFVADDNNPSTTSDVSQVYRDYPVADITSDRKYWTAGAGVLVQDSLTLDVAYLHGSWERSTPADYQHTTTFYPTVATREKVSQDRVFVSTTFHFE